MTGRIQSRKLAQFRSKGQRKTDSNPKMILCDRLIIELREYH
jgi:hypothetical protein